MWIARILVALGCGSALLGRQTPIEQAWDLAAGGQRDQAIQILYALIEKTPADADARLLLGSLLSERGNAPEAIDELSEAVRLRPHAADAQNALGEALLAAGDANAARTPFEEAAALKPGFAAARTNLGSVLLQAGEYAPAAQHLDLAIGLLGKDPEVAYARYLRAKVYTALADPRSAARELEQAIAVRSDYAEAWSDLGQLRKLLLDEAGALAAFKRAVDFNPADAVAQYRLGAQCLRAGELDLAANHLEAAYRLKPDDQSTLNALQSVLRQQGKTEEAAGMKRKLADLLRQRDEANQNALAAVKLNNDGAALQKQGDLAHALEDYRKAAQLYPSHVGIRVNYAVALLRLGHWAEGLDELHEALQRDPGNAQIRNTLKDAVRQAPAGVAPDWAERK